MLTEYIFGMPNNLSADPFSICLNMNLFPCTHLNKNRISDIKYREKKIASIDVDRTIIEKLNFTH